MTTVLLTTRLKVADPTALTALATLRTRLHCDAIGGLTREEVFVFEIDAPPDLAGRLVETLARETNLFMNPNKHLHRVDSGGREKPEAAGPARAYALIWMPGEGEELRESIWRHAGAVLVKTVRHGWLWRFTAAPGGGAGTFARQVNDSLVLKSRTRGFLVNPACQESRLYDVRPSVYDTREALAASAFGAAEA